MTGASRGIGLAITRKFLAEGFDVITISRHLGQLESLLSEFSGKLHVLQADLSVKDEVLKVAGQVKAKWDGLDVLVNNAGAFLPGQVQTENDGTYELLMALNISAPYHLTRALLPMMTTRGDAYIFNMCSTASIMPYINGGSYCISKHALLGFSKVLRQELMPHGIGVSAVLPGATLTDSWAGAGLPDERFIHPSSIAECLWFAWQNRTNCVMEEILLRPLKGDI